MSRTDADYPLSDPRNERHEQHRLYSQIDEGVERLSGRAGGVDPEVNERTKMSLFNQADRDGLKSVDHLVINRKGTQHEAGTLAIMVDGKDPYGPENRRACMDLVEAARQQIDQSMQEYQSRQKTNDLNNPTASLQKNIDQLETQLQQQLTSDSSTMRR